MTKEKDIKKRKYYFRIYSLKDYSILFNMEIKKEYMQYITQYKEDFYLMELFKSFLGFKFLSKDSARIFFLLLNEDPKEEIIKQNEGAMSINPNEISKTLTKVSDYIKARLKFNFDNYVNDNIPKTTYGNYKRKEYSNIQEKENFSSLIVNDIKGQYLDTSVIPDIEILINNLEIDDADSSCYLFTEKKLNLKKCQEIVKSYEINSDKSKYRRKNEQNIPLTIIDKDCHTIANTDLYAEIMTKNMINNITMQKRLEIFKKEHKKKHNELGIYSHKLSRKTKGRPTKIGSGRISNISKLGQEKISLNNYNLEKQNSSSNYMDIFNNGNNNKNSFENNSETKSVEKENSGKFAKDKRKINSMVKTEIFKEMENEDEDDIDTGKYNYFSDSKANNKYNNINKGINAIEEKPEDDEKEKEYQKIIKDIETIEPNNKRGIYEKEDSSMSNFLMSTSKNNI